jgi:uncharacterized membrane protein
VQPGEGITPTFTLDLRDTSARVLAYPGQAETAVFGFNMAKGVIESGLEGAALSGALGQTALTTARLFEAATEQGIPSTIITDRNLLWLEQLPYSDEAKARITLAALDGNILIAPQEPVWIDGDYHLGWWQVDALSGETIGVMENGLHLAAIEYLFGLGVGSIVGGPMTDFILGFTSYTLGFVADRIDKAIGDNTFDLDAYLWQVGAAASAATCLSALASIIFTFDVWAGGNCGAGIAGAATGATTDFFGLGQSTAKGYLSSVVQYDPPVPQNWQAVAPPDGSQPQASAAVAVAASTTAVSLNATLTTGDLTVLGGLNGGWAAAAAHTFPAGSLNANGALRDADGMLLGNGLITAVPATGDSFSLQANPVSVALQGNGRFSLYAPALNGLGGGANWGDFTAQLTPGGAMLLTLRGATTTLGGVSRSGDFTIETNNPANLGGLGAGAAANFAASANWQATAGQIRVGPASGAATLGGVPLNVSNGLAVAGYDGGLPISQSSATTDQVTLQDNNAQLFTLNLSPESSSAEPLATTTFQAGIFANFSGVYTVTASAPPGWDTPVGANGAISVRPPSGAAPGEYAVLVTAQSAQYPALILTAVHTVSVGSFDGFAFAVEPDNIFTVPMGPVLDPNAVAGSSNTGQAQIPGAAYTIFITNTANAPRTFDVSVSGLPPGWTLLSQSGRATSASLALPPGALGMIGLYVDPNNDALPSPGTTLPFVVTAVSNTGLNQSANLSFTMPGVPFSYVTVEPPMHYVQRGEVTTVTVDLSNVGNAAGTFPLTAQAAIPAIAPVGPPQSPFALAPGQMAGQVVTLAVGEDAPLGQLFPVWFSSPAPDGVYTQTIATHVWVVDEVVGTILAADACRLGSEVYREALYGLATAVIELQQWCERGDCPLPLRDRVATAGSAVAGYARAGAMPTVLPGVAGLETAVAHLSTQTSNAAILAAVADLSAAVASLGEEVCLAAEYGANGRFTPSLQAILLGETADLTLAVSNRGAVATTYAVTITGLAPAPPLLFSPTVPPGATVDLPLNLSPDSLGVYTLNAEIVAQLPEGSGVEIRRTAVARLNVVDKFIQLTEVSADPPFVDVGGSATTLQTQVVNFAGVGLAAVAETAVVALSGATQWSGSLPLTILGGAPRLYDLAEVNTSGWAAGVYTITVDLRDAADNPIADGSGYGYLSVGQAVIPSHAVYPALVAPGTVTVTTVITTEINQLSIVDGQLSIANEGSGSRRYTIYDAPYWHVEREELSIVDGQFSMVNEAGEVSAAGDDLELPIVDGQLPMVNEEEGESVPLTFDDAELSMVDDQLSIVDGQLPIVNEEERETEALAIDNSQLTIDNSFFRVEQDDASIAYSGAWSNVNLSRASGGSYWRSTAVGATAVYTFSGNWLNLGFIGTHFGGYVDVAINGSSQGLFDLYRREDNTPISFVFADLGAGPHTVTLTVAGSSNPFSSGTRVQLDYIDYWDGVPLGDGLFEETDARVLRGGGWTDVVLANASGGGYGRGTAVTAWLPFDGDSFTYQAIAYNSGGKAQLFVDGNYLDTVDLYHPNSATNALTRTFSYEGFGSGQHILQINSYRGTTTLDAFSTPGAAPFTDPNPAPGSINRYEEEHPAILYNGAPYPQTAQGWSRQSVASASDGQYLRSATAGDSVSFDFTGTWVNLGFYTDNWGGYAEIFIDGQSQGVVDLYRREATAVTHFFPNLTPGNHTVSVTVLGSSGPFASGNRVQFDFVEFGDGSGLDDGAFEQDDGRILRSGSWVTENNANASGGSFSRSSNGHAWFHFAGDSFTYQAIAYSLGGKAHLYVDGQYLDTVDLYHPNSAANGISRTFSYDGFGSGPHVLQISSYRGQATLDRVVTPGQAPFTDPNPPVVGVTRYQEEHPAIRYNGVPYDQTAQSWNRLSGITVSYTSDGQVIYSQTAGDSISFDFEGSWIGVGFFTDRFSGQAEIAIDGDLVAEIDLYTRASDVASYYFSDLGSGPHTITITVLGTRHPNSRNNRVHLDYFDVWDGQPLAEGLFEESDERIIYSNSWSQATNAGASGGGFAHSSSGTAWFPFTGDSVTLQSWTAGNYHSFEVKIDGVSQGYFNNYSYVSGPRAFSFDGLGDGPHVLEVRQYRGLATVDTFTTPATGENYTLPTPSGIIRIEEDHPDLRYNGYPLRIATDSWSTESSLLSSSGGYHARTGTAGNALSLAFAGTWVGVGFSSASWSGVAEIFIDGASRGTFDTSGYTGGITSIYYDDLAPGTHVISITAVSGTIMPDFIDIWDGQTPEDGWHNATLDDYNGRFHYSNKTYWGQYANQYAHEGDFVQQNLVNANPNIWFTFVGHDLTLLAFNRSGSILHVAIDGQPMGEFNMTAQYSDQPYALHFPDLGDGPHVVQIHTRGSGRVDAFEVNPEAFYSYTPQVIWHDNSAKEQLDPAFRTGFLTTIGIGDLNGDGNVELVAPGVNGRLYVYRGDGQDTGDGTPLLWTSDAVGVASEPALADITGDGAAEIIVSGYYGTFAFRHDGFVLWQEENVKAYSGDVGGLFGWGGPTVGNLDDDPKPEIVIAASQDALYVLDHQGNILDSDPIGRWPSVPVLADITADGTLDIIVAQGHTMKLYSYDPLDGLEIVWTYTLTQTTLRSGVFGSPAVADLTGDGQPEIIINWGHRVEALRADGSLLWSYYTGSDSHYRPSPITVADVTGDGQVNIITASAINAGFLVFDHNLMVLTAAGELVWEQTVADNTASASGVAAQDLTGNGVWEILWNGATDGFLIIRGHDGKRLFNERITGSGTIMEYPTMGDVDGDGVADVVVAGREGIFVISHVGHWINSRPLWNQHNYHVTNINDDWSTPLVQPNNWELHNTYRTQTPEQAPAPSYRIEITHTVGLSDVTVLPDSFSTLPGGTPPQYHWQYQLEWYAPVNAINFASELAEMRPGETRQVNQGTEVAYRLPSGWNYLTLPPLFVTAARLGELAPAAQEAAIGTTAVFTLTLFNPANSPAVYSLQAGGLPAEWFGYPASVPIGAGETVALPILIHIPPTAEPDSLAFWLDVDNGSGGADSFAAELTLLHGLELALSPFSQTGRTGQPLSYTLTISNLETTARTYDLTAFGLADVTLPETVAVAGNGVESVTVTAVPPTPGPQTFTIEASLAGGLLSSVDGVATGNGRFGIVAQFQPETVVTGPGATAVYTLTLTNVGDAADSYALSLDAPAGWTADLTRYDAPISEIVLPGQLFNSAELLLFVTPAPDAQPGSYPITLTAQSLTEPGVVGTAVAIAEVSERGVQVSISPPNSLIDPRAPATWEIAITNLGSVADSYALTVSGVPALAAAQPGGAISLAPGASQTVQFTVPDLRFLLPGSYGIGVLAESQSDGRIRSADQARFTILPFEEVTVAWQPESRVVTDTLTAGLTFVISNTGNVVTEFQIELAGVGLAADIAISSLTIPPRSAAIALVDVSVGAAGSYTIVGTAESAGGVGGSAIASLTFVLDDENQPPVVGAGPDQLVWLGWPVQFSGSATDPDGDEIVSILWDFGDGSSASGTLTPTHSYAEVGVYTVTLTVTDSRGGVGVDSLTVTAHEVQFLPMMYRDFAGTP